VRIEKPGYTGPNAEQDANPIAEAAGTTVEAVDVSPDEDLEAGDDAAPSGDATADRASLTASA
jgi:single-strand DNA-binding protein